MPTTDDYGQGVKIAALTDAPNGQTLASDIVNQLVPRTIMRFQSASERNATLTPEGGMMAWLETEELLTLFDDGVAEWTVVAAGSQKWTNLPLASGWSHDGNSNGNAQYRVVNFFGEPSIMLRGAIGRSSYPATVPGNFVITSVPLPPEARPTTLRTINVPCSDVNSSRISLKLDLRVDGHLQIFGTGESVQPPWIGFNGTFCSL